MDEKMEKKEKKSGRGNFFLKKPLYIVILIVASVVLIADLVIHFTVGAQSGFGGDFTPGSMPDGVSSSEMPDGMGGGEMPSGSEMPDMAGGGTSPFGSEMPDMAGGGGEMPSGSEMPDMAGGGGEMPSGSEMPDMAGGGTSPFGSEMPDMAGGGTSPFGSEMPDGMEDFDVTEFGGSQGGFLSWVSGAWIPILVICLLLDAGSIVMLVMIGKKKQEQEPEEDEDELPEAGTIDDDEEEHRHRNTTWIGILALVGAVVAALCLIPGSASSSDNRQAEQTVQEETAETGSISTTLSGTGTLAEEDGETVTVPETVEITSFQVEENELVEAGTVLAKAEKTSVMTTIETLQETLAALDTELAAASAETGSDTVTAASAGRVKKIYGTAGASVVDTMYNNGALMLLSLDGLMAVDVDAPDDAKVGDSAKVVTSDKTEYTGRIAALKNGTATVTVSDEKTDYGETVTVYDDGGTKLGDGTLYIHSELKVTALSGTIKAVSVSENASVASGATLFTLSDVDYQAEYVSLLAKRQKLEEQMQTLFQLYQDPYIYAETAGSVTGVDDAETVETAAKTSGQTAQLLASTPDGQDGSQFDNYLARVEAISENSLTLAYAKEAVDITDYSDLSGYEDMIKNELTEQITYEVDAATIVYVWDEQAGWQTKTYGEIRQGDVLVMTFSRATDTAQLLWIVCTHTEESIATETPQPSASQTPQPSASQAPQPTQTQAPAVSENPQPTQSQQTGGEQEQPTQEQPTQQEEPTDTFTYDGGEITEPTFDTSSLDESALAELEGETELESAMSEALAGMTGETDAQTADGQLSQDMTGLMGTEMPGQTTTETEEDTQYTISEKTVCTITPQDTMTVSITIDELDINQVAAGDEVEVTLDAIEGESFAGTVTTVGSTGTNEGGNTKYTVEVTMDRTEQMLVGMNANVTFVLSESSDVLLIPENALQEEDGKVFVYTSYDEKKEELGDPVEVTTGVSDGENVEITEGLSEGDTYYYQYADTVTYQIGQ